MEAARFVRSFRGAALGLGLLGAVPAEAAEEVHGSALMILVMLPDDVALPIAVGQVNWGYLHLEPRYGYEATESGSFFAGANFKVGNDVWFLATPMVGFIFGKLLAISGGWELTLGWKWGSLYVEGEVPIDLRTPPNSYLYVWSELNFYPTDFLRCGLALQRTRVYNSDLFVQPGAFIGLSDGFLGVSFYLFNVGIREPTWNLSVYLGW